MLSQQEQFFRQLDEAKSLALSFNKNWSGDSLAAGLALAQLLIKLDKKITLAADPGDKQYQLAFLPFFPYIQDNLDGAKRFIIKLDTPQSKIKDLQYQLSPEHLKIIIYPEYGSLSADCLTAEASGFPYDAAIALGSPDLASLGSIYQAQPDFFQQTVLINLDASPDNEAYGRLNLLEVKTSSVSELVWQLFSEKTDLIDADIATCLLAGIISATNNFKVANLAPQTLAAAAELIRLGARREEIVDKIYRSKKIDTLKLWGSGLAHLALSGNQKLAWTFFNYQDIKEAKLKRQDLISLIEDLIANLNSLETVIIFVAKSNETAVLVYCLKNFDALTLLKNYSAQGNKKLAQTLLARPLEATIEELVPVISRQLT
jgi:nanoRNase/pAp phosphatase (c-di-AMP/oligoRNAs hydrolase)